METVTERNVTPAQPDVEPSSNPGDSALEAKRALLAGLVGGIVGTAGYLLYTRLEEEQKNSIRRSISKFVEEKVAEIKSQLKL